MKKSGHKPRRRRTAAPMRRPAALNKLHVALRQSFQQLPHDDFGQRFLRLLDSNRSLLPAPLLGIAVWNLLPMVPADKSSARFGELLRSTLNLELDEAKRFYAELPDAVFPPYPEQEILESSRLLEEKGGVIRGRVEVSVTNDFQQLKQAVIPRAWSVCRPFWSRILGPAIDINKYKRSWTLSREGIKGSLHLPDGVTPPHSLLLDVHIAVTPFEARTDYIIRKFPRFESCRGYVCVQKEPGRPGTSRLINERVVRFAAAPAAGTDLRLVTLDYWLRAETACLALALIHPRKAALRGRKQAAQ